MKTLELVEIGLRIIENPKALTVAALVYFTPILIIGTMYIYQTERQVESENRNTDRLEAAIKDLGADFKSYLLAEKYQAQRN